MAIQQLSDDAPATTDSPARRCFIAARFETDIWPLRQVLVNHGIDSVIAYEEPPIGASIGETVMALMESVDLVVAVLDDPSATANVYIEIGYAVAMNKRVLVLVGREFEDVPADLKSTFYVRAAPSDTEAVSFAIRQLLAAPARQVHRTDRLTSTTHPIGSRASELVAQLGHDLDEWQLLDIVVKAVSASGASVNLESEAREDEGLARKIPRSDLAVWSDDIVSMSGAPLLVEVVKHLPSNGAARALAHRLRSYLQVTSSGWALVLYLEGPSVGDINTPPLPQVIFMRIEDFLMHLGTNGLATVVRQQRNFAVHGRPVH